MKHKGSFIRDVRSQGGGEFVQCGYFADKGGSSDADVCTFWHKKLRIFLNLWCIRTDKGVEPVRTFCGQGGQFFAILCGRLLWTASNALYELCGTCCCLLCSLV